MDPHQQRVVIEKQELDDKLQKLTVFINQSPVFTGLPAVERDRLVEQRKIMADYADVLHRRIAAFPPSEKEPVDPRSLHVAQTKQHRVDLDEVLQRLKMDCGECNTPPIPVETQRRSRERSLAITKLQEAIMWLGMDLKAQDTPNPYPNSYNPASPVIDKTADGLRL